MGCERCKYIVLGFKRRDRYQKFSTLMCLIKGSTRLGLQRVFSTKNLLIRHQPIYFKRKFHPRQDVYYILFAILFSNISKTYKSKTLIVNHFCPGRLYFFKNPSESHLLWTRLLLGTWEYLAPNSGKISSRKYKTIN